LVAVLNIAAHIGLKLSRNPANFVVRIRVFSSLVVWRAAVKFCLVATIRAEYLGVRVSRLRVFPMAYSLLVCSFQVAKAPINYQENIIFSINMNLGEDTDVVKVVAEKLFCRHTYKDFLSAEEFPSSIVVTTFDSEYGVLIRKRNFTVSLSATKPQPTIHQLSNTGDGRWKSWV